MIATTEEEKNILRECGKRLASIMDEAAAMVRPGVMTGDIDAHVEKRIREIGDTPSLLGYTPHGAQRPYPATICISVNDEVVHGIPTENSRLLVEGDIVGLDCVMTHNGMFTDMARTVACGKISDEDQALMDATKAALMAGISAAHLGGHIGDISAAIEKVGVDRGYGIVYELGGHGVGHAVHEQPYVPNVGDAGTGDELVEGMVLAVEPMFTLGTPRVKLLADGYTFVTRDGSRAAHFEHSILITKNGAEILTQN